jgi:hypothetical protein
VPPFSELPIPNLFLASLPQDDFEALRPHFEMMHLPLRQILHEMGTPIEHCYFMDGGMTSLLIRLEDGASIEAGVVGKEGFAGSAALMGFEDSAPLTSMIQIPGMGLRIASDVLRDEMLRRPALLRPGAPVYAGTECPDFSYGGLQRTPQSPGTARALAADGA